MSLGCQTESRCRYSAPHRPTSHNENNGLLDKGVSRFIAVLIASIIRLCSDSGGTGMSIAANSSNLRLSTVVTDFTSSLRMNGSKALIP